MTEPLLTPMANARRRSAQQPHFVYQLWRNNDCLYVGMSASPGMRLGSHAQRDWWVYVTRIVADVHPNRDAARAAEFELIQRLDPLYNFQDSDNSVGSRSGRGHGGVVFRQSDRG